MLDQNTDRMWYVIGAVIVGAAIILILNGTAPELFASVADTFKGKTDEVTEVVEDISSITGTGNLADPARFRTSTGVTYTYDSRSGISTMVIPDGPREGFTGIYVHEGLIIKPGEVLTIEFDIYSDQNYAMLVDHNNTHPGLSGNDHRPTGSSAKYFSTVPGEWMSVTTSYTPSDTAEWYKDTSTIAMRSSNSLDDPAMFTLRNIRYTITDLK